MRFAAPLATAGLLLLAACETVPPCTECPVVAGRYDVVVGAVPADESSCGSIFTGGWRTEVTLVQDGSGLVSTDADWSGNRFDLKGTLFEQLLVEFEPTLMMTSDGSAARMTLGGGFSGEEGARILNGTMKFDVKDEESCRLNVPVIWTQIGVAAEQTS